MKFVKIVDKYNQTHYIRKSAIADMVCKDYSNVYTEMPLILPGIQYNLKNNICIEELFDTNEHREEVFESMRQELED